MAEYHPLKRLGTPDDVASVTVFLASETAAWITGQILDVTGGGDDLTNLVTERSVMW
jgi:NAD(P)-dependent dehydrogenase (short-subunit alcohol dehydrogenase family)